MTSTVRFAKTRIRRISYARGALKSNLVMARKCANYMETSSLTSSATSAALLHFTSTTTEKISRASPASMIKWRSELGQRLIAKAVKLAH